MSLPPKPSYEQLAALVVEQAATIERLEGEIVELKAEVRWVEGSVGRELPELVAAAVLRWTGQGAVTVAVTEESASLVGAQARRAGRPFGRASGAGRCAR